MAGSEGDAPIIVNNGGDGHLLPDQENSPKQSLIEEEKEVSSVDDGLVAMEAVSKDDDVEGADSGQWEVLEETRVAVDYSNVHVFLKTLNSWQEKKSKGNESEVPDKHLPQGLSSLQVNFDEALCQQIFPPKEENEFGSLEEE